LSVPNQKRHGGGGTPSRPELGAPGAPADTTPPAGGRTWRIDAPLHLAQHLFELALGLLAQLLGFALELLGARLERTQLLVARLQTSRTRGARDLAPRFLFQAALFQQTAGIGRAQDGLEFGIVR
jgi:hypothetical protein